MTAAHRLMTTDRWPRRLTPLDKPPSAYSQEAILIAWLARELGERPRLAPRTRFAYLDHLSPADVSDTTPASGSRNALLDPVP